MEILERYAPRAPTDAITMEEYGKEPRTLSAEEAAASRSAAGVFSEPSGARRDYQDAVRTLFFRDQGLPDRDIASRVDRPERWVSACVASPRCPASVPPYVADYAARCADAGVEPFKPAELWRGFAKAPGAVRALQRALAWTAAPALRRDYETGEVTDTGARLLREKSVCGLRVGVPSVDRAIAAVVKAFRIDDPGAYILANRYKDGRAFIAPHQHDFWSATFSFGAPRMFLLDQRPLLLEDGDVLIFGSQRHTVPKMPKLQEERISLSLFWYPNWRADCDYSDAQLAAWRDAELQDAEYAALRESAVTALTEMGFGEAEAVCALCKNGDDVDLAAAALVAENPPKAAKPKGTKGGSRWKKRGG